MPRDQFGRRVRMSAPTLSRTALTPRRARQLKLAATAATVLAIGLSIIAAIVK